MLVRSLPNGKKKLGWRAADQQCSSLFYLCIKKGWHAGAAHRSRQRGWPLAAHSWAGCFATNKTIHCLLPAFPSHHTAGICAEYMCTHIHHTCTRMLAYMQTHVHDTRAHVCSLCTPHTCACTHSHTPTHACAYRHTQAHTSYIHTHSHEHAHMCTHHMHTLTYKHPCTYMLTMTHTCAHTCTHSHTYTYTHTTQCTYVCTHTHTTHACTSTQACTRGSQCGAGGDSAWPPPWRCHLVAAEAGSNQRQWEGSGGRSLFADYYW